MDECVQGRADPALQDQLKQRGRPFQKGQSGNPAGRPPGIRNRAAQLAEHLLAEETEALTRKAIELALRGDPAMLRLCLERLVAVRRERTADDLPPLLTAVSTALAEGELSPTEAGEIGRLAESFVRVFEASDFERRLKLLEARHE